MLPLLPLLALASVASCQYTATYNPSDLPDKSEKDQKGTNKCGTGSSQDSMCQNAFVNQADDFCVWGPPEPGPDSTIGNIEQYAISWCTKSGYGTRLIPDGTLKGVHFVETPDYVQVTGTGDFTKINIPKGDDGGEMDPHGPDGLGNPHGGLVFSSAFGTMQQVHEWTNFMSDDEFCFRACKDGNTPRAKKMCQHIYDVMGCRWNMPANYEEGVFEYCEGESGEPMGVYGTSTFHQGEPVTPPAHPPPKSSNCVKIPSISNGAVATVTTTGPGTTQTSSGSVTTSASGSITTGSSVTSGRSSSGSQTRPTNSPSSSTGAPTSSQTTSTGGAAGSLATIRLTHLAVLGSLVIFVMW